MLEDELVTKIEEVGDEFSQRLRAGEKPRIQEYVNAHPELGGRLREFLEAVQVVCLFRPNPVSDSKEIFPSPPVEESFPEIQDYQVLCEVGRGGMGVVYEAWQVSLDRRVALKLLPRQLAENENALARFHREAKSAAALHHTNVVPVFDVGTSNGHHYYAMQFISGTSLKEIIIEMRRVVDGEENLDSKQPVTEIVSSMMVDGFIEIRSNRPDSKASKTDSNLSPTRGDRRTNVVDQPPQKHRDNPSDTVGLAGAYDDTVKASQHLRRRSFYYRVAKVGRQVADALAYAHESGVIHRDIKPANLLMDGAGNVWVADFGLAKTEEEDLTRTGDVVGTLRYMSPERFAGHCDGRSDIYSLGATLYEMIVLRPSFAQTDYLQLIDAIANQQPARPRSIDPAVPMDLETIILKAIDKDPQRRYATAAEMAADLTRFVEGRPIQARHVSLAERTWIWARRNPLASVLSTTVIVGTVLALIAFMLATMKFRDMAISQSNLTVQANQLLGKMKQDLYFAQMQQAYEVSRTPSGIKQLRGFLDNWGPVDDAKDYRGWEWYWLQSIAEQAATVVRNDSRYSWFVEWSSDGNFVCWSSDETTYVSHWPDLNEVWVVPGSGSGRVVNARFDPMGDRIAISSLRSNVQVWDWREQNLVQEIKLDSNLHSEALCWEDSGKWLAIQTADYKSRDQGKLFVYETSDWSQVAEIEAYSKDYLRKIAFNPDGSRLATATMIDNDRGRIKVFDTATWQLVNEKELHSYAITSLDWHWSGDMIASGGTDHTVNLWDLNDDRVTTVASTMYQTSLDWQRGESRLAFGGWDQGVSIWTQDHSTLNQMLGHQGRVYSVDWSSKNVIASSADDGEIRFWNLNKDAPIRTFYNFCNCYSADPEGHLDWSLDDRWLSASNDAPISIFDLQTGKKEKADQERHLYSAFSGERVAVTPDQYSLWGVSGQWLTNRQMIVASSHSVDVWDTTTNEKLRQIDLSVLGPDGRICMEVRKQSNEIFLAVERSFGSDGDQMDWWVETYELATGKFRRIGPKLSLNPGTQVVTGFSNSDDGNLVAMAMSTGRLVAVSIGQTSYDIDFDVVLDSGVTQTAWSADGQYLAVSTEDHSIRVFETSTWKVVKLLKGHANRISALSWHPSGTRLASGSDDKTARLWDLAAEQTVLTFEFDAEVRSIAFSHGGEQLALMCRDGMIKVYDSAIGVKRSQTSPSVRTFELETGNVEVIKFDD